MVHCVSAAVREGNPRLCGAHLTVPGTADTVTDVSRKGKLFLEGRLLPDLQKLATIGDPIDHAPADKPVAELLPGGKKRRNVRGVDLKLINVRVNHPIVRRAQAGDDLLEDRLLDLGRVLPDLLHRSDSTLLEERSHGFEPAVPWRSVKNDQDVVDSLVSIVVEEVPDERARCFDSNDADQSDCDFRHSPRAIMSRMNVTVLCVVRHGYATTEVTVESLYRNTEAPFRMVYADIASPPAVERYLKEQEHQREGFLHLRFDDLVSRQSARHKGLENIETDFVVVVDNNMVLGQGWLEKLLAAAAETGAALVSPIIVTHGGDIHFSAGLVERKRKWRTLGRKAVYRPHQQPAAPVRTNLAEVTPHRIDIDFAESHCCLVRTECLKRKGVLEVEMHNAHTICAASYRLKHEHGEQLVLEPSAVAAIVPIGFGYDLPWMCRSYMRQDLLRGSYKRLRSLIGKGPGTDVAAGMRWHTKHFKYLLLTMLDDDRLTRENQLRLDEIPETIRGYDEPLAHDASERIRNDLMPYATEHYPELVDALSAWLDTGGAR